MAHIKKALSLIKNYILVIVGSALVALALDIFLVPHRIASGGVTGIATVVYHLTGGHLSVGLMIAIINIPLFLAGMKAFGKGFMIKSGISTLLLSAFTDILQPYINKFSNLYIENIATPGIGSDLMLYAIFGGVLMGAGTGLVLRAGGTTGGTDIGAALLHKALPGATFGQILLFLDGLVVLSAAIAFKSMLLGLYAIVAIFIATKIIDTILEGVNFARAVYIITDRPDEISQVILFHLDRGVTALDAKGMYTHKAKKMLFCVMERTQIPKMKQLVKEADPDAFIVMADVREVLGEFYRGNVFF